MVKGKMYPRIQDLKKKGYGKLEIGRELKIDPATVRKYYSMSVEEYRVYQETTLTREKVFDDYKDEILAVYESNENRRLNMSGVYDYLEEMGIKMYVCRKADPESKGKIENVIKYVKYNFLSVRDFETVEEANESVVKWLQRRANGKISQGSKKVPSIAIEEERIHLKPVKNSIYRKDSYLGRESRTVSDKSFIMVAGKEYSVPMEYRSRKVEFYKTDGSIYIFDSRTGKEIAVHTVPPAGGERRIANRNHFRNNSLQLNDLESKVLLLLEDDNWKHFVKETRKAFSRYSRDQFTLALDRFKEIEDKGIFMTALTYCLDNKTYGMKKLFDTYQYLLEEHREESKIILGAFSKVPASVKRAHQVAVSKRPVKEYETLLNKEARGVTI